MEQEGCDCMVVVGSGMATFALVNSLTGWVVPDQATKTYQQRWKWRNVATSLVHSIITGIWAPLAFYQVLHIELFTKFIE